MTSTGGVDVAIRTGRFIRNSCLKYWMENRGVSRNDLSKYCKCDSLGRNAEPSGKSRDYP